MVVYCRDLFRKVIDRCSSGIAQVKEWRHRKETSDDPDQLQFAAPDSPTSPEVISAQYSRPELGEISEEAPMIDHTTTESILDVTDAAVDGNLKLVGKVANRLSIVTERPELGFGLYYQWLKIVRLDMARASVEKIPPHCFESCSQLQHVKFPATLRLIGLCAFRQCTALMMLFFAHSKLAEIGVSAFDECGSIKEVRFPPTLRAIGASAFRNCGKLQKMYFGQTGGGGKINFAPGCFFEVPHLEYLEPGGVPLWLFKRMGLLGPETRLGIDDVDRGTESLLHENSLVTDALERQVLGRRYSRPLTIVVNAGEDDSADQEIRAALSLARRRLLRPSTPGQHVVILHEKQEDKAQDFRNAGVQVRTLEIGERLAIFNGVRRYGIRAGEHGMVSDDMNVEF